MKPSFIFAAVNLLLKCHATKAPFGATGRRSFSTDLKNNDFIIELEPGKSFTERSVDPHDEFHKKARDLDVTYSVRHEFKNRDIFYGLTIEAANGASIRDIKNIPGVKNVWKDTIVKRPAPVGLGKFISPDANLTRRETKRAPAIPTVAHANGTSNINVASTMTGVDKLHSLGIKGKGVKIAIIDSGADYTHPSLGGGFGDGFKVVDGYDFVGDDYTGRNSPQPDPDPMASCLYGGHGTHVAGIVAGQDPQGTGFGFVGVAPEATLYIYRIFGCLGDTQQGIIWQAIEAAVEAQVDIISMSLGFLSYFDSTDPFLTSIKARGIAIIASAGNDGSLGPYHPSFPSVDSSSIGVGSVNSISFPTLYNAIGNDDGVIEYGRINPMDPGPFHIFLADDGPESGCNTDAWDSAVANFPDRSKIIALISPGGYCEGQTETIFPEYGIRQGWFGMDDTSDLNLPTPGYYTLDYAIVRETEFAKLMAGIDKYGRNYTLSFDDSSVHDAVQPTGGMINYFSTFGPSIEMTLKPQISAPGGNIFSLWPTTEGVGYAIISGTSMAAPHIAGCFALLKSAFPSLTPNEILGLLQSTASPVPVISSGGSAETLLAATAQQGAGLVNVYKAYQAQSETSILTNELSLRDSATPAPQTITIENKSLREKTYTFGHIGASLINTAPRVHGDYYENQIWEFDDNAYPSYASAAFSSGDIVILAGGTASFTVAITAPGDVDPDMLPIYGGYVVITDDVLNYTIPYLGVPYSRSTDSATIDFSDVARKTTGSMAPAPPEGVPQIPIMFDWFNNFRINDLMMFDFRPPHYGFNFYIAVRQPTSYIRVDAVHPHQVVHPDRYGFDRCHRFDTIDPDLVMEPVDNFLGMPTYGEMFSLVGGEAEKPTSGAQYRFQPSDGYEPYGAFTVWTSLAATVWAANGTMYDLPNADYRFLIRALKSGYDVYDPNGYASWLSPIIRINATASPDEER